MLLKLSKPVQHHLDLRWGLVRPARLDHQKSLAVRGDVIVGSDEARKMVMSFEKQPREACSKAGRECSIAVAPRANFHRHHPVAITVKELLAIARPDRFQATLG